MIKFLNSIYFNAVFIGINIIVFKKDKKDSYKFGVDSPNLKKILSHKNFGAKKEFIAFSNV